MFTFFKGGLKLLTFYIRRYKVRDLLRQIGKFWIIEHIEDEEDRRESLTILKYMKMIYLYFLSFALIPTIFFCFRPFLLHQRVLAFDSYIPDSVPYFLLFLLEDQAFLIVYVACISFDTFFATLVLLTKVQFKLLNQDIKKVVESKIETLEDEYLIRTKLKRCIDHHNFLFEFIEKINDTISSTLLIYFIILIFSMCVEMFIISNRGSIKELIKTQLLTSEAEETTNCAYLTKWYENLSNSTKCTINMISLRGQKKVYITAGKFVNLGMESCLSTYKTIFSYYMFLMTLQGEDEK
ncbi:hypothetical protein JTB14_006170 [Gonioctena quinquepunctata]|nr:hypothetical protein JTB14_006170 [Gonioctena quinquepunctata]